MHTIDAASKSEESHQSVQVDGLPSFGAGKTYPQPLPDSEDYVVSFDGPDDLLNPQNWHMNKKYVDLRLLSC